MAAATMAPNDKIDNISAVAQDYYDSDNAFNFYRQVRVLFILQEQKNIPPSPGGNLQGSNPRW